MYGYVYLTTDLETNKIYIGQHKAESFDTSYYGSGIIISKLIKKYGKDRFKCDMLEECFSAEQLNEREIYHIADKNSTDPEIGYNIATGGAFGDSGYHLGMLGKHQSDYQKECARRAKSKPATTEAKAKMSASKLGNKNAAGGKGMKFINKDYDKQKRVPEEDIPYWESQGWSRGKCQKIKDNQREAYKKKYSNGTYITDGINSKFVDYSELDRYLQDGWREGKGPRNYVNRINYRNK